MARTIQCKICRGQVKASVAAHDCPHGNPCRFQIGDDGLPVDWSSPDCFDCREDGGNVAVGGFGLTAKAEAFFSKK